MHKSPGRCRSPSRASHRRHASGLGGWLALGTRLGQAQASAVPAVGVAGGYESDKETFLEQTAISDLFTPWPSPEHPPPPRRRRGCRSQTRAVPRPPTAFRLTHQSRTSPPASPAASHPRPAAADGARVPVRVDTGSLRPMGPGSSTSAFRVQPGDCEFFLGPKPPGSAGLYVERRRRGRCCRRRWSRSR